RLAKEKEILDRNRHRVQVAGEKAESEVEAELQALRQKAELLQQDRLLCSRLKELIADCILHR
ncbi:MAG: hypothetical protein GY868_04285, partial [Deltaproteobacteria bacterium]|nr:hypothetical protein [Deltaproteobacteria bacterium]